MLRAHGSTAPRRSLPTFLRGSKMVLSSRWTASQTWRPTAGSTLSLLVGLWLFGAGEAFLLTANLGAAPWVVLEQGLRRRTGHDIGLMVFVVSLVVLLCWIPLRQRPGLGTLLNLAVIPIALQLTYEVVPTPTSAPPRIVLVLLGIVTVGLGSGFYLTAGHGPGPRDGWMTGLHRRTGRPVAVIRFAIEITVLILGIVLGGTFGVGTVIFALLIGQSVAMGLTVVTHLGPPLVDHGSGDREPHERKPGRTMVHLRLTAPTEPEADLT